MNESISKRNKAIAKEYFSLRKDKFTARECFLLIVGKGIYKSSSGKVLSISTLRNIVTDLRYLERRRKPN